MLLPWVVLPLCRPDLQKCRENGSGSKVTSARGGVPYRSALQRISSWRGSSLDRQTEAAWRHLDSNDLTATSLEWWLVEVTLT